MEKGLDGNRDGSAVEALILDLLEWVASGERSRAEVLDVWRTSCPRLPVWEDANDRGFVEETRGIVGITAAGLELLKRHGRR
jgi:hypothetical protein